MITSIRGIARALHGTIIAGDQVVSARSRSRLVEPSLNGPTVALETDLANAVLRWSPDIRAMVALFSNIMTGRPQAVCKTFLDAKGNKTKRMFLGPTR